jgi:uncharacterized membrane protein (UPF0127 family)
MPFTRLLLVTTLLLSLASHAYADTPEPLAQFPVDRVLVESSGKRFPVKVWIAATPQRHAQGLMYVKSLAPDEGMLFVFAQPSRQAFWMKNTFIPLDLVFIAADGRIVSIAARATPRSLKTIDSREDALGVLEVPGGTAARLGWQVGDFVSHPAFGRANR